MLPWNCCRTCLETRNLNRIFSLPERNEKLTNAINNAIGIQIDPTDNLPQLMCSSCVKFVNEINKFRKKAKNTQTILKKRLDNNEIDEIKHESLDLKLENDVIITIDTFDDSCDYFKDYEEKIAIDNITYLENENDNSIKEFETAVEDNLSNKKPILNSNDKKKNVTKVKTVRKLRSRKTEADVTKNGKNKTEQAREEVECEYCHKILTSKLSLRNHHKIHTGFDFVCEHCGKKFITRRLLLMHCRAKHGYEKTDKCSFCDYRASNAEQVKIHERLHTGERPYVCKDCGAGFHRKSSYLQHVAIHLPEKTVQCDQCPARFKSVTLMHIHKSRHRLPTYSYRCSVCGNNFARRRNVARHLQRVHALQPEPEHIQRDKIS